MKEIIIYWVAFKKEYDAKWQELQPKGNEALWLDGPTYRKPEFSDFMDWCSKNTVSIN